MVWYYIVEGDQGSFLVPKPRITLRLDSTFICPDEHSPSCEPMGPILFDSSRLTTYILTNDCTNREEPCKVNRVRSCHILSLNKVLGHLHVIYSFFHPLAMAYLRKVSYNSEVSFI
jgi:hypothetical protein